VSTMIEGYDRRDKQSRDFKSGLLDVTLTTIVGATCLRDHGIGLRKCMPAFTYHA
jgi:hypothetical protein